jgi:hypothetical protein
VPKDTALEKKMRAKFGTTQDPYEAGIILEDGTMLDFSGRAQVSDSSRYPNEFKGKHNIDHSEMNQFAPSGGSKRFYEESAGKELTDEEYRSLKERDIGGDNWTRNRWILRKTKGVRIFYHDDGTLNVDAPEGLTPSQREAIRKMKPETIYLDENNAEVKLSDIPSR